VSNQSIKTKLSAMDKKKYLLADTRCPYCGSNDISGGFVEIDSGEANQKIDCMDCGKRWRDVYRLVDMEELSDV